MWSSPSKKSDNKRSSRFLLTNAHLGPRGSSPDSLQTKGNGVERLLLHVGVLGPKELSKLLIMDWPGFERSEEVASHH